MKKSSAVGAPSSEKRWGKWLSISKLAKTCMHTTHVRGITSVVVATDLAGSTASFEINWIDVDVHRLRRRSRWTFNKPPPTEDLRPQPVPFLKVRLVSRDDRWHVCQKRNQIWLQKHFSGSVGGRRGIGHCRPTVRSVWRNRWTDSGEVECRWSPWGRKGQTAERCVRKIEKQVHRAYKVRRKVVGGEQATCSWLHAVCMCMGVTDCLAPG